MKHIFSIDVEDWFHILELETAPSQNQWESLESRVEHNFLTLLDMLDDHNISATCFFLGWIAEKYPHLVTEAASRSHEIASHGYSHQLVYNLTEKQFYEDLRKTKDILEQISGNEVIGYRAPGYSITPETIWAFHQLAKAGYRYDSSLFPAKRGHGYFLQSKLHPYYIEDQGIYEFPMTVVPVLYNSMCFFGGGYLRLFPYWLINMMENSVLKEERPVVYYIHPRDIDADQPRLDMNAVRTFKSYVNLKSTKHKLKKIFKKTGYVSFSSFLDQHGDYFTNKVTNIKDMLQ